MRHAPVKVFTSHGRIRTPWWYSWFGGKLGERPEGVKRLAPRGSPIILRPMPPFRCRQIEVHLFRRRGPKAEFLLLRRSPDRTLASVWQPVTGGIERGETAWRAAAREVLEETGLRPVRWWALEHLTAYYETARDAIHVVPLFAAEVAWTDTVQLSHEHDRYAFVSPAIAARRVLWGTQRIAQRAVRDEVFAGGGGAKAREITARIAGLRLGTRIVTRKTRSSR